MKSLAVKIATIASDLGAIQKDSTFSGAGQQWKFISQAQLLGHLRSKFAEYSIAIFPSMKTVDTQILERSDGKGRFYRHEVECEFTVVDGESGESFTSTWFGESIDTQDKGVQKAATSAEKYFLMKLLKVSDKDDPDSDDNSDKGRSESRVASAPPPTPPTAPSTPHSAPPLGSTVAMTEPVKALIWLAENTPDKAMWHEKKITALLAMYEKLEGAGKLKEDMVAAGTGVNWVFQVMPNNMKEAHLEHCPDAKNGSCGHLTATELAVLTNGTVK